MASNDAATRANYQSLPGKRIGAGLICRDADDRVLLVQPTYKPTWEIPGGVVEAWESPAAAVSREVREELGTEIPVGRLLVVDWLPVRPPKTEGLMMQFDGGIVDESVTDRFRLPPEELRDWRFFAADELEDALPDYMARRTRLALELAATGRTDHRRQARGPACQLPQQLQPRIAVTVDRIATGTDVRPIEIVFFMRSAQPDLLRADEGPRRAGHQRHRSPGGDPRRAGQDALRDR